MYDMIKSVQGIEKGDKMSTRGVIATGEVGAYWYGVYHHSDSYPSGLGKAIFRGIRDAFGGDTFSFEHEFIRSSAAMAGWRTIVDADLSLPPVVGDSWDVDAAGPWAFPAKDGEIEITSRTAPGWLEYAYVLWGNRMSILSNFDDTWVKIAVVELDGPEPDWSELDRKNTPYVEEGAKSEEEIREEKIAEIEAMIEKIKLLIADL